MTLYAAAYYLHVTCVVASGSFFFLRGCWMLLGSGLLKCKWVRILPHVIDTLLLGAAIAMLVMIDTDPTQPWLISKIVLLLVYIGLGVATLRGPNILIRATCFVGALATFLTIVSVALLRHPAGILSVIFQP